MAATGSAVGLGNIWGFPTNAAQNGGAAFLLLYLVMTFVLAWPALMAELLIGRHTRANVVDALRDLAPNRFFRWLGTVTGYGGLLTASLILAFYAIIAGWILGHWLAALLELLGQPALAAWFVTDSIERNLLLCLIFSVINLGIIIAGVTDGIERWSTWLMPALVIMLIAMVIYVLNQPGAMEGLRYYLIPDLESITQPGLAVSAMGQSFFALSLGVGTMLVYGSYISSDANVPRLGTGVALIDTSISFLAGLLIIPALTVLFTPWSLPAGLVAGVIAYALILTIFLLASRRVQVIGSKFTAGYASIDVAHLGEAQVLNDQELRVAIGRRLDARAYLCVTGWVKGGVKISINDVDDPTPYWVVTTRRPQQLLDAIAKAQQGQLV